MIPAAIVRVGNREEMKNRESEKNYLNYLMIPHTDILAYDTIADFIVTLHKMLCSLSHQYSIAPRWTSF